MFAFHCFHVRPVPPELGVRVLWTGLPESVWSCLAPSLDPASQ